MSFDDVRDLYQEIVLDRARHPRHMHRMEPFDARACGDNPLCGDQVELRLRYGADGSVAEAAFEARGCAISLASADLMAELVRGRQAAELRALASAFHDLAKTGVAGPQASALQTLMPLAGVSEYPSRVKCATLPWAALVAALDAGGEES